MIPGIPARMLLFLAITVCLAGACTPVTVPANLPTPTRRALPALATTSLQQAMECLVVSVKPTSGPTTASIFPAAKTDDHSLGPENAEVTFVVYTDFQSQAAAALNAVLQNLAATYPQSIRWVQRPFPLPSNDKSILAAAAVEAAARQGKYWEMSSALFSKQADWSGLDDAPFQDWLAATASELQLDSSQFRQDLLDPTVKSNLVEAQRFGLEAGIPVIPFLLTNGEIYQGPRDSRSVENLVNLLRMKSIQFTECPPFVIDPSKEYTAELETTKGRIVLQLFPQEAPLAVNNFVYLARKGWYDGVGFHRVIADYVAQSGDPSGTGFGSPGYAFPDEISALRFDRPGMLAMANVGPDSNGSQFFITYKAIPELNGLHTIFGQVLEGNDVLAALTQRDPSQPVALAEADRILRIAIHEK